MLKLEKVTASQVIESLSQSHAGTLNDLREALDGISMDNSLRETIMKRFREVHYSKDKSP